MLYISRSVVEKEHVSVSTISNNTFLAVYLGFFLHGHYVQCQLDTVFSFMSCPNYGAVLLGAIKQLFSFTREVTVLSLAADVDPCSCVQFVYQFTFTKCFEILQEEREFIHVRFGEIFTETCAVF